MRSAIALLACVLSLLAVNVGIAQREKLLASGRVVYLELAPVDPRSLMQGDYMALRFRVANDARPLLDTVDRGAQIFGTQGNLASRDGHLVVTLDARSIGQFARLDNGEPLASNEARLRYRVRAGELRFATNAFYFQEGFASFYQNAKFGELRVAENGDLLLTSLRGPNLEVLGPPSR